MEVKNSSQRPQRSLPTNLTSHVIWKINKFMSLLQPRSNQQRSALSILFWIHRLCDGELVGPRISVEHKVLCEEDEVEHDGQEADSPAKRRMALQWSATVKSLQSNFKSRF